MVRVGIGYDVHRFGARRPLKLGGFAIPFKQGLAGHSDADVLLHAIADAILGAIGSSDIGEQFPSSDPRLRNAQSSLFVSAAYDQAKRGGWSVANIDTTVIADRPRLIGYKKKISRAIAALLAVDASRISVKAKTTEGFCPAREGIAAQAIVLLEKSHSKREAKNPKRTVKR